MIHLFSKENSIINNYIAQLRDTEVQKDSLRFRNNLLRIGMHMGYEISKQLNYKNQDVQTPLGIASMSLCTDQVVLGTILRAGLPLHDGLLQTFDQAENAIISAYRKHDSEQKFHIEVEYMSSPSLEDKVLILCDPMLATGMSMVSCWKILTERRGMPKQTHVVSVIASEDGLNYTRHHLPHDVKYWMGAVDPELNAKSYIIPGLGDAGDLAYGVKL
jgi:uracil phosphoribosyltransferase